MIDRFGIDEDRLQKAVEIPHRARPDANYYYELYDDAAWEAEDELLKKLKEQLERLIALEVADDHN